MTAPRLAVEVLEQQPFRAAPLRPLGKVAHRRDEAARIEDVEVAFRRECLHEVQRRPRGRMADAQRLAYLRKRLPIRVGPYVTALVTEFGSPVTHRRKHQVRLLPVKPPPGEDGLRFDQQDRLLRSVEEMRAELITEEPASFRFRRHASMVTGPPA